VRVIVPHGSTMRVAAESLARAGVVQNATAFRLYARMFRRSDRSIRAGTYVFQRGRSWGEVLDDLRLGKGMENGITIPEGWSLYQIVPQLARVLNAPVESVQAAVRVMVDRFEHVWQPEWDQRLQALGMSRNDVMALASIVEKEARLPEERPVIAAVYLNRLRANMLLQADPTVQYALGKHVARVMYKDLNIESPYNTYRHVGLPPGPIASPGRPSIVAALNPANVPYRYFVAYPDGHHEFTTDFARHAIAVRNARRQWDSVAALRRDTMGAMPLAPGAPLQR
jgi:UPF0755 protein